MAPSSTSYPDRVLWAAERDEQSRGLGLGEGEESIQSFGLGYA